MHIQKAIEKLGYGSHEVRVYLASLRLGPSTATEIAESLDLPRTSVQAILAHLHHDGLMNFFVSHRYKRWTAENPERLLLRLRENEASLRAVMPELVALRHMGGGRPTVKVFVGTRDIDLIHADILATKHPFSVIAPWGKWCEVAGGRVEDFLHESASRFLRSSLLVPQGSVVSLDRKSAVADYVHIRFLPHSFKADNVVFLYGHKTAFISLHEKAPTAVLIDAPDVHVMMKEFFEDIWNRSRAA